MFFRKNRPIRIEFILVGSNEVVGFDEIPPKSIPEDFEFPTLVDIDGRKYSVKATDPVTRVEARKAKLLKVWMEAVAEPVAPEAVDSGEVAEENESSSAATPTQWHRTASRPELAPRTTGARGDYHFVELMPWQWRQVEFVRREFAPEIGEEFAGIQGVIDNSAMQVSGQTRYAEQYVRSLTHLTFRGLEISDIALQTKFFPFGTRQDGVALMGQNGFVDSGFAYVLPSGIALYGQEFEGKIRFMGLTMSAHPHPANIDEDADTLSTMMAQEGLVLVDWDQLTAVEASADEMRGYLSGLMVEN